MSEESAIHNADFEKLLVSAEHAALMIARGKLVAFPTETVYGLGASALNEHAVQKIFKVKGRPQNNPLICHLSNIDSVFCYGKESELAVTLAERYWPGPLTMLLENRGKIPSIISAGSPLVGFRIPDHPLALKLLHAADIPVSAPSANLSNRNSPTHPLMVYEQLGNSIDGIVDGGACRIGVESTVVRLNVNKKSILILREGGITQEQFLADGFCLDFANIDSEHLLSPGRTERHYEPTVPMILLVSPSQLPPSAKSVAPLKNNFIDYLNLHSSQPIAQLTPIAFNEKQLAKKVKPDHILHRPIFNEKDTPDEIARRLYDCLGSAHKECKTLIASPVKNQGIGRAINERLVRASTYVAMDGEPWSLWNREELSMDVKYL